MRNELVECARMVAELDERMLSLNEEIQMIHQGSQTEEAIV